MVKHLVGTENVSHQIDALLKQEFFGNVGLIVGQKRANLPDLVVYLARTPNPEEGEATDNPTPKQDLIMDIGWMQEHVKQVARMLPGGLSIIGLVLVNKQSGPEQVTGLKKVNVEKVLQFVANNQAKTTFSQTEDANTFCVMSIGKDKSSLTVQSLDVDSKSWKPANIKFEDKPTAWQVVKSNFLLDYPMFFDAQCDDLSEKFAKTLSKVHATLDNAIVLFDNEYRSYARGEMLNPLMKKVEKKGKKSKKSKHVEDDEDEDTSCQKQVYNAEVLIDDEGIDCDDIEVNESGSRLRLSGKMTVRVYMHPEATVLEAIEAVKEDILRTISARLDIHCDSLVGDETKGTEQPNVSDLFKYVVVAFKYFTIIFFF